MTNFTNVKAKKKTLETLKTEFFETESLPI